MVFPMSINGGPQSCLQKIRDQREQQQHYWLLSLHPFVTRAATSAAASNFFRLFDNTFLMASLARQLFFGDSPICFAFINFSTCKRSFITKKKLLIFFFLWIIGKAFKIHSLHMSSGWHVKNRSENFPKYYDF